MKKNNNQNDVLELEAEEMLPELQLEKKIEQTLVKANVTEQVIAALKDKYGSLRLKSIDDKESFLELVDARKNVRKIAILAEKACKAGRENAVREQKLWLAKEKEVCNKIAEVQNPIDADIKKFEDEVERKEIEAAKQREAVYMNRQATLSKLGATYNNGSFELKHISYEIELIKQADEEQWNDTIFPKYKKVYEEIEAAIVEEENKRKAENERLQKEKEEFEEKQRVFRQQQEEFQKQQAELQRQKDEADRKERERKLQEQRLIDAANEKKWRGRLDEIKEVGWNGQFAFSRLDDDEENPIFTYDELLNLPDDIFNERLISYNNVVAKELAFREEKRLAKIAEDLERTKQLTAQQERERIENEQRQAEERKQHEAQRKAAEMELASDKEKYAAVIGYLIVYPKHEMKSNIYKGKMNAIAQFIQNL